MAVLNTSYISAKSRARMFIHPVLLEDESGLILIDCGGSLPGLRAQALDSGMDLCALTRILITHHDQDHISALADCREAYPRVRIAASRVEAEYISGKKDFERLAQAKKLFDSLPPGRRREAAALIAFYASIRTAEVHDPFDPPVFFPWCDGMDILSTPGHTPGHISVYLREFKTLIAGDALVLEGGRLSIDAAHTLDMQAARQSVAQFLDLDIQRLVCYHGGVLEEGVRQSILSAFQE